ncbi:mannose-1-phosphate guanylyltransferase/mannose-6-phosphate isomerase [Thiolapillus brandeum]|uniref:mannose-1-phosphate guanylyltransferase n=1 Tax=Thiolapillus brandeum TaxID=1076588 RepID=A0A7U6GH30_9GAMM|nr:mannose-1-phosphate guanylyltransferase/mannose-6-phosphate isomerase [Thiolapillus brandeum]BAO43533.1 mannose-6-phosphate isomerase [Thiolapillus brandeum]
MIPVILSGGSGTRLWPVSRKTHPKQFWPLVSDLSLLQMTCQRLQGYAGIQPPIVVCNSEHRFFVAHQLEEMGQQDAAILLEPVGRNTAPAIAVAALHARRNGNDPVMLVLPSDHLISDPDSFYRSLEEAEGLSAEGYLVTFGVVPNRVETGYGYIKAGSKLSEDMDACSIDRFVEKPALAEATSFVESGAYYWNSGMFMFRASRFLDELERFSPDIFSGAKAAYDGSTRDLDFIRLDEAPFAGIPGNSVDYAVMEHTDKGVVVPLDAGWSDVGSWSSLWELGEKDGFGNVTRGDVLALDSENCYLHSDGRLLAVIGVHDLVVVDTPDVVMIAQRDFSQRVGELVSELDDVQRQETDVHTIVHRPWGCFQGIDRDERYRVKRISVRPGARLSLQMHHHRAEHWIVVKGTARVTCGDKTFLLSENESTYIPVGEKHCLENPGIVPLDLIEIQSGSYLGEDDIVRFEDLYGRET